MRIQQLHLNTLRVDQLELAPGETHCLLGGNGSGKSVLAAALAGELDVPAGALVELPRTAAWVAFETQQATYEAELARDDSDFMDGQDPGSTALQIALQSGATEAQVRSLAAELGARVSDLLARHFRTLSSGETRLILLLKALASTPELLILDEPFEGLDRDARVLMTEVFERLQRADRVLLVLVNRREDVPAFASHLGLMARGRLLMHGPRDQVLQSAECRQLLTFQPEHAPQLPSALDESESYNPVVRFSNCSVSYGGTAQFADFSWELRPLQHTSIVGPNGAGKSTLLQLISGDHPQCYVNDIEAFGYRRGSGESIWDIKKHIGLVSPALHRDYRAGGNALSVIVSGAYDSIGVYQRPSPRVLTVARAWLRVLGMEDQADRGFRQLSYGQQRLLLIARGLIKQPPLLILDEPTQGLDDLNRHLVLAFLEQLSALHRTTLLFVSHREDEHLSLFTHRLRFEASDDPAVRYRILSESGADVAMPGAVE